MFDKYPYTDFHEMNLDWIIKEMKDLVDSWDSFGGNVSAEAHVSTEPEVSVQGDLKTGLNFDFGLVQGQRGAQGPRGPQGEQGPAGNGLEILDIYATLAELQAAHPTGTPGDAYLVGSSGNYTLYIWSSTASAWSDGGSLTSPSPSNNNPAMDGTAAAGSSLLYSRADHVHPSDSTKLNVSNNDGVYAVVDGDQVMRVPSSTPSAGSIVEYDSNGYVSGNNVILNSPKLDGIAASSNAYQPLTTVSANTPVLGLGEDLSLNTPSVKFMGTKFANDGTTSDATSEIHFSRAFKINDTDYSQSRIDLNPATTSSLGGVVVGDGLVVSNGTVSNAYHPGDTITFNTYSQFVGLVAATRIYFTIPLVREVSSAVQGVSFTSLRLLIKGVNGSILTTTNILDSSYSLTSTIDLELGTIAVVLDGLTGLDPHRPVCVELETDSALEFA